MRPVGGGRRSRDAGRRVPGGRSVRLAALATTSLLLSCGGSEGSGTDPVEADPGPMSVVVAQAPADAGGVVIQIDGDVVGSLAPTGSLRIWEGPATATRRTVLLAGPIGAGTILTFQAADRNGSYTVRVVEAAAGSAGGYALHAPGGYSLSVQR